MTYLVIDLSFSDITEEWVRAQVARGVKVIFVCAWTGGYALNSQLQGRVERNLWAIYRGGAIPAIYSNATPYYHAITSYRETLLNCGTAYALVKYVMVDIEIAADGNPIRPEEVHALALLFKTDGKTVCTYSADWYVGWWKLQLGDANAVQLGYPYVHARYDLVADIAVHPPVHPIGPVVGKQYQGSHDQNGISIDSDIMYASFFSEEDSNMPDPIFYVDPSPDGKYRAGQMSASGFHAHGVPWIVDKLIEGGAKKVLVTAEQYDWLAANANVRQIPFDLGAVRQVCAEAIDAFVSGGSADGPLYVEPGRLLALKGDVEKLAAPNLADVSDADLAAEVLRRMGGGQ